jgi:hypothetical protein
MRGLGESAMRRLAVIAIVLGCGAATNAAGQSLAPDRSAHPLMEAAFAPTRGSAAADPIGRVLDREAYAAGQGPVRWTTSERRLSKPKASGRVDSLRVSVGGSLRTPGGLPLNLDRAEFDAQNYEVSLIRNWPSAVSFETGNLDLDLSPHAGVGVTSRGGSAEAGAMLKLSQRVGAEANERLRDLGVREGSLLGDQGRWYLFAAASGQAVGLNILRGEQGWDRAGWTTDPTSTLVGDAQVGVGWRKGMLQSSFGYMHREIKGRHMIFGQQTREDSVVAFTLSIKPGDD